MNIHGSFLVFGVQCPPAVVLLTDTAHARLDDALGMASRHGKDELRHDAYRAAFHLPAQWAIPCWSQQAMAAIATGYHGPHEKDVRGLAACIATGTPYGGPEPGDAPRSDDSGGQRAPIDPVKPKPRKPSGSRQPVGVLS